MTTVARLGDIVISTPVYDTPGLVQWDLGIAQQDNNFRRIDALDKAPEALRTAVARLRTQYEIRGQNTYLPSILEDIRSKEPMFPRSICKSKVWKMSCSGQITNTSIEPSRQRMMRTVLLTMMKMKNKEKRMAFQLPILRSSESGGEKTSKAEDIDTLWSPASGNQVVKDAFDATKSTNSSKGTSFVSKWKQQA